MLKNVLVVFVFLIAFVNEINAQHKSKRPPLLYQTKPQGLELPDNATSIRENIVDTFSCDKRIYGYYADIDNECQIFHICVPQARHTRRFSFICPAETVFNQLTFVCSRSENSIPCPESEQFYYLNEEFGKTNAPSNETTTNPSTRPPYPGNSTQRPTRPTQGSTQYPTRPTTPTTTPDWSTQTSSPGSTQYPTRPTSTDNSNSQGSTGPSSTTPNSWSSQSPQRPTRPPGTSTPDYPTTQNPQKPTRPPTYPPSSSSTPDNWTSQRPQRPARPPNRPTTTPQFWSTQYTQRPPRPITQNWQYVDDDYSNY